MKKTLIVAIAFFGTLNLANAQAAPDITGMVDQQAGMNINTLISVGASLKKGDDAYACYELGSTQTSLAFISMMVFQAIQGGMIDPKKMLEVQKAMTGFANAATQIQINASAFCKVNQVTDTDRKGMMAAVNNAGKALATVASNKTWTTLSL